MSSATALSVLKLFEKMTDAGSQIKKLTILMALSNIGGLLMIEPSQSSPFFSAPFVCVITVILFVILYYFYKGRNWARRLILIGSALSLFNIFLIFTTPRLILQMYFIYDFLLACYLLWVLNQKPVKEYFNPPGLVRKKPRVPMFVKVLIGAAVFAALVVGGFIYMIIQFEMKSKTMNLWLEDLATGEKTQLTTDGFNDYPQFSPDGSGILFTHGWTAADDKNRSEIKLFSLTDRTSDILVQDENANGRASWTPDGQAIVYVAKSPNKQMDLWRFSIMNKTRARLTDDPAYEGEPSVSGDGKWILFKETTKVRELYLLPLEGGQKRQLTQAASFLDEPQSAVWLPAPGVIAYIRFVSLNTIDTEGKKLGEIDLAGLNNFTELFVDPSRNDVLFFKARPADSLSADFNLYQLSLKTREIKILRKTTMMEWNYDISPDGRKMVYSKPD